MECWIFLWKMGLGSSLCWCGHGSLRFVGDVSLVQGKWQLTIDGMIQRRRWGGEFLMQWG